MVEDTNIVISNLPVPIEYNNKTKKIKKIVLIILLLVITILAIICFLEMPRMVFAGSKVANITYLAEYNGEDVKVIYHGEDITSQVKVYSNVDTSTLGEYTVIYELPYFKWHFQYIRYVNVVDNINPEIVLNGEEEQSISYQQTYQEEGYTAKDNYDGDITDKVEVYSEFVDDNNVVIHYQVKDSSGNSTEVIRKINYFDNIKPDIELIGDETIYLTVGQEYEEQGATATDERDGDLTEKIQIQGTVDTTVEGIYPIIYSVIDNSDNEAVEVRQVIVKNTEEVSEGTIYLTFDDGPSKSITPYLLDVLKEKGIKATFFILDYGESTEYLVKRIVEEGHSIGIHGGSHDYAQVYSSPDAYLNALDEMKEKIKNSTGVETNIIRFPGGSSNTVSRKYYKGIMTTLTKEVLLRDYRYYDWNVASGDSGDAQTSEEVYENVINGLDKDKINMVLMHDFGGNEKTLEAVPKIIDYAISNGYTFEKITNTTPMIMQEVQN